MAYQEQNRQIVADYFRAGAKPSPCMLGVEVEHFVLFNNTNESVPYQGKDGSFGVLDVLEYLASYYPQKSYSADGSLIGLASDKGTVTLEPAAQLELSIAPRAQVSQVEAAYREFRGLVDPYLLLHGARLEPAGYHPSQKAADLTLIPKERYRLMTKYFAGIGTHGERMMRATASTQVSVDFSDEADGVRKLRVAQALAPVLASLAENTASFEGAPNAKQLTRLNVWRDVDNKRCGSIPGLFNEGWGFADYADWLLNLSPIFVTRPAAGEPDYEAAPAIRPFFETSAAEAYADAPMTSADVEHLMSMVWPDVRLKRFVEIRPADSLPLNKILAYTALVKGLFYSEASLVALEQAFGVKEGVWPLNDKSTDEAVALVREQGDGAVIYGKTLGEWKRFVVELAAAALGTQERAYLAPFEDKAPAKARPYDALKLEEQYVQALEGLNGDLPSREAAQSYLAGTKALRNGEPVPWAVVPKIFSSSDVARLRSITGTMYSILEKLSAAYALDPEVRKLFAFSPSVDAAVAAAPAIGMQIPIARYDIFLNEETGSFKFCEINTDGSASSVITEEVSRAVRSLKAADAFAQGRKLTAFEPVQMLAATIARAVKRVLPGADAPALGIVDYTESLGVDEAKHYIGVFEKMGIKARISDIRQLRYENGELCDDAGKLDAVWRRVVISEMEEKPCAGADALVAAAVDGQVPVIGSFRSWPAATKTLFAGLFTDTLRRYLTPEELEFVDAHVPRTYVLGPQSDLSAFADRAAWILKPADGYGSHDVIAGADVSGEEWEQLLRQHQNDGFIVQEYAPQFATPNAPGKPADDAPLAPYSNMEGLFVFDGELAGVFTRSGTAKVIDYTTSRLNLGCIIVED